MQELIAVLVAKTIDIDTICKTAIQIKLSAWSSNPAVKVELFTRFSLLYVVEPTHKICCSVSPSWTHSE
jgi:hypothetical protein